MLSFSLKYTTIVGSWGSAPDPAGGAISALPDPLVVMGWDRDLMHTYDSATQWTEMLDKCQNLGLSASSIRAINLVPPSMLGCFMPSFLASHILFLVDRRILAASISGPRKKKCEKH